MRLHALTIIGLFAYACAGGASLAVSSRHSLDGMKVFFTCSACSQQFAELR